MAGILTKKFRLHMANQFKEQFDESEPSRLFLYIGRPIPWADETNPPVPVDTIKDIEYDGWNTMLAMKRITASDTCFAAPRYNWLSGEVYTKYSVSEPYYTGKFYVITEDFNVYLCLKNGNGAPSTVKPSGTSTEAFSTQDGYKWKYLYSISASDALRFLTQNYIPVKFILADDGSTQWAVQQAAVDGAIDVVDIINGGTAYQFFNGDVVSATATTISLSTLAATTDNIYNGYSVYIKSGVGAGQHFDIVSYDGVSRTATINGTFSVIPDATSTAVVSPKISISGGTGFFAYCEGSGGTITNVVVVSGGQGYSDTPVTVSGNVGSGAVLQANPSPKGGHGANAVNDLYAHNIIMNTRLTGTESDTFIVGNEFRVMGILLDPTLSNGDPVTATVYDLTTHFDVTVTNGSFNADEIVTGQTSGATAYVVNKDGNDMRILPIRGTFVAGETIRSNITLSTGVVNSITGPNIKRNSGRILYVENRNAISRALDQQEDIKFVVKL
ncbi:baseplate structural protein [Ochrobactrum phage vB_OspM_OC]|nr:baseplate structural protein [Ochrobactrum phage vB_OspM_OC]